MLVSIWAVQHVHHPLQNRHNACPAMQSASRLVRYSLASHLIPVLFHTSFCSIWKRLEYISARCSAGLLSLDLGLTLAISPQLFPASLMTFSRCSSAGLHGVFVLLFLGAGMGATCSASSSPCSRILLGSPRPVGDI